MLTIKLVSPTLEMEKEAQDYIREHKLHNEYDLHGAALLEKMPYSDWVRQLQNNSMEETVTPGWVPASTFFGIRQSDGKIIGTIDIRHKLNDFLSQYGGHIWFWRSTDRKKKRLCLRNASTWVGLFPLVGIG